MKPRKIIVVGHGGSGKDHLAGLLVAEGYTRAVSCTTRPRRVGEVDGVAYHFLTGVEFRRRIAAVDFREWYSFGADHWLYGTLNKEFREASLFVMNPHGLAALTAEERAEFSVVFLNILAPIRRLRLTERADSDSVARRLLADADDFRDFSNFDVEITAPDFTVADVMAALAAVT